MKTALDHQHPRVGKSGKAVWIVLISISLPIFTANYVTSRYVVGKDLWALALSADVSLKSQQLALQARKAVDGEPVAFTQLKDTRTTIGEDIKNLQDGHGPYSGLHGAPGVRDQLQRLADDWTPVEENADLIIRNQSQLLATDITPYSQGLRPEALESENFISDRAAQLLSDSRELQSALGYLPSRRVFPSSHIAVLSGALMLIGFVGLRVSAKSR